MNKSVFAIFLTILLVFSAFSTVQPYWRGIGTDNAVSAYSMKSQPSITPVVGMDESSGGPASPTSDSQQQGNGDIVGTFVVNVLNDDGGTKQPSDFTINILADGGTASPSSFAGSSSPGTKVTMSEGGNYNLGISTESGYTRTLGADCPSEIKSSFSCTITFNDVPREKITPEEIVSPVGKFIVKVINDNGGTKQQPSDFTINILANGGTATPSSFPGSATGTLVELAGEGASFTLEANKEAGYTRSLGSDCPTSPSGYPSSFTCTILFDDIPQTPAPSASVAPAGNNGTIDATFIVKVINDDGGSLSPKDFTINWFVSSGSGSINPASFKGQGPPGTRVVFQGIGDTRYDAKLNQEPGYTRIPGGDCPPPGRVWPSKYTCTVIFDDIPKTKPQLHQFKGTYIVHVFNNYGGTLKAEDIPIVFNTRVGDITPISILGSETGKTVTITPDPNGKLDFTASLPSTPGYTQAGSPGCDFRQSTFQDFTCTINLYEIPPLKVTKKVINDNAGQSKNPEDFTIRVTGDPGQEFKVGNNAYSDVASFQGSSQGTDIRLAEEGRYSVTEVQDPNYDTTYSPECNGVVTINQTLPACVVTNDDKQSDKGTLIVEKYMINDNGGTKEPWDFMIHVRGANAAPSDFKPSQQDIVPSSAYSGYSRVTSNTVKLDPGQYNVTEDSDPQYTSYFASFTPCSGEIKSGETLYCVITNDDNPAIPTATGTVTVYKNVIGGTGQPSDFTISVTGNNATPNSFRGSSSGTVVNLNSGSFRVTENLDSRYSTSYSEGCSGNVIANENKACIITNDYNTIIIDGFPQPGTIVVNKYVINNDGGRLQPSDFTISVTGNNPTPSSFRGSSFGTLVRLDPGSFTITENLNSDYITTYLGCTGTISENQTLTCSIINDDKPKITVQKAAQTGNVRVTKNVINDDGGTRQASDFVISVNGNNPSPSVFFGTASPGATDVKLAPGLYTVTETLNSRYDTTYSAGCTGIISTGETRSCTITNNDKRTNNARLVVIKTVINDDGRTKQASDFTISVTGNGPSPNLFGGRVSPGTTVNLRSGPYSVTETPDSQYTTSYSQGCSGTITSGETRTCNVTNNDRQQGTFGAQSAIRITKNVINDNGGTKQASGFTISLEGTNPDTNLIQGTANPGRIVTMDPGSYSVTENEDPAAYDTSYSAGCTGTLGLGEIRDCVITNNDKPTTALRGLGTNAAGGTGITSDPGGAGGANATTPGAPSGPGTGGTNATTPGAALNSTQLTNLGLGQIQIIKYVVNDNNGTKQPSDFTISIAGNNPSQTSTIGRTAPGTMITLKAGPYTISETQDLKYRTTYSPDCIGTVVVAETKTCTITNNDKALGIFGAQTSLIVMKNLINDNGGTKQASDFVITVTGNNSSPNLFAATGSPNQTSVEIDPGNYKVEERNDTSYQTRYSPDCQGTIMQGETKVCIVTNDDNLLGASVPVDVETLKFGRSQFPSNGTIVLADVSPLQISGGHVLLNIPNNDTRLVAAQITDAGIEHAIMVPLVKVPGTGKSLYHADLATSMNGTNPFTGKNETLPSVSGLVLWNNATAGVTFGDDHGLTETLILDKAGISVSNVLGIDVETLKFGRAQFPANGTIVLTDVSPLKVVGGHVLLNIPNNNDVKLVAAHITDTGIEHAVAVPLIKVFDPRTGERLYDTSLQPILNGTNPFSGITDSVSDITDLLLLSTNPAGISFDDDHGATATLILSKPETETRTNIANFSSVDLETIKFGRSQFPSNGTIVLADVSPLQISGGHVLLNIPNNNNDTKLVAAQITDTGIEHAIVVPLIKAFEPRTGEALYHADLQISMNGTNPFTGKADLVDNMTDIILWNNATSGVSFDDDHGATLTVLLNSSELLTRQLRQLPPGIEIASTKVVAPPATANSADNQTSGISGDQIFTTDVNQSSTSINQTSASINQTSARFSLSRESSSSRLLTSSIDLETLKFGSSQFPSNGTIVLADVSPLQISGGHVLLNLPNNNNDTKLVAAQITDAGIEHAIMVPLVKVPGTGKSLYHADLATSMNGTNPYTGKADLVDNMIDIILWNNATSGVTFDDDHGMSLILKLEE